MRKLNKFGRFWAAGFFVLSFIGTLGLSQPAFATQFTISDNATGGACISIGTWDSATKTCTLTGDLPTGDNIVIGSSGITLDGAGHSLTGTGSGNGILAVSVNELTIKNTRVSGFVRGISLIGGSGHTIEGNTLESNPRGIDFRAVTDSTIINNTAGSAAIAIFIWLNSENNHIEGNTVTFSRVGIDAGSGSHHTVITRNIVDIQNWRFPLIISQLFIISLKNIVKSMTRS